MKATEQYFAVVLFIMLYKVVLTIEFMDKIPKWDREQYVAVLSFIMPYKVVLNSDYN